MGQAAVPALVQPGLVTPDGARARQPDVQPGRAAQLPATGTNSATPTPPISVVLATTLAALSPGDELIGLLEARGADGRLHIVTSDAVFAVEPESALPPAGPIHLRVISSGREVVAQLIADNDTAPLPLQPLTLTLVDLRTSLPLPAANAAPLDGDPVALAETIARALFGINLKQVSGVLAPQPVPEERAAGTPADVLPVALPLVPVSRPPENPTAPATQPQLDEAVPPASRLAQAPVQAVAADAKQDHQGSVIVAQPLLLEPVPVPAAAVKTSPAETGADHESERLSLLAVTPAREAPRLWQAPLVPALARSGRLELVQVVSIGLDGTPLVVALEKPSPEAVQPPNASRDDVEPVDPPRPGVSPVAGHRQLQVRSGNGDPLPPLSEGDVLLLIRTAPPRDDLLVSDESLQPAPSSRRQDALDRILRIVTADQPVGQLQTVPEHWPKPGPNLPGEVLLLFNALGKAAPAPLQQLAARRLARPDASEIQASAVQQAMQPLSDPIVGTAEHQPESARRFSLPLVVDGQVMLMHWHVQSEPHRMIPDDQGTAQSEMAGISFSVSVSYPNIGAVEVRGHSLGHRLDLALHSSQPLPETLRRSAGSLYARLLEAGGMNGRLTFRTQG